MDGYVSCVASLFQVFMQAVESGAKRAEEKEAEERKSRREEGFLPLSSCPQHLLFFFFRSVFFAPSPLSVLLELGAFLAPADSAVAVRKNDIKAINASR